MLIFAAPWIASAAIDQGQKAHCDGVLISAQRAKEAVACKRELNLRRTFECQPCPDLPEDRTTQIASASFAAGLVLGLLLLLVR